MHLQDAEGSGKLFLCILCHLISWLHPDDQIIVLVQFWHVAYNCVLLLEYQCWSYPGQSDFVLLSQTPVAILYDIHQIIMSSIQNIRVMSRVQEEIVSTTAQRSVKLIVLTVVEFHSRLQYHKWKAACKLHLHHFKRFLVYT